MKVLLIKWDMRYREATERMRLETVSRQYVGRQQRRVIHAVISLDLGQTIRARDIVIGMINRE